MAKRTDAAFDWLAGRLRFYFLRMGKGNVFSLFAVLSSVPLDDSKKSDVSVVSLLLVLADVEEDSDEVVLCVVACVLLVAVVPESDPIGLFLPQLAMAKTEQRITAANKSARIFFIFIVYILSKK